MVWHKGSIIFTSKYALYEEPKDDICFLGM
jgi:hypothetical protein